MPKQTFINLPQQKRQAILDLAIEEFAENDYNNASISRIVARAGIAKGSFYQYFEDKEDLYFYLLDIAAQEKLNLIKTQKPPDPRMNLFDYLRWLFASSLQFQFTHPRLAQVGYRALYGNAPLRSDVLSRMKQASLDYYRQLVEEGIQQGSIDPAVDKDIAVFVLSSTINELGNYIFEKLGLDPGALLEEDFFAAHRAGLESIVANLLKVLEHGLGVREEETLAS